MIVFIFLGASLAYHGFTEGNFLAGIVGSLIAFGASLGMKARENL